MQWISPAQSWYKINTDGATFVNTQSVGIGVIIQDYKGQVEAALNKNLPFPLGPMEIEGKNIGGRGSFCLGCKGMNVLFERDSKIVVDN